MERRSKVLECECGHVVREADDEAFVAAVQLHARDAHGMTLSREQVLGVVLRKEGGWRNASEEPRQPETVAE